MSTTIVAVARASYFSEVNITCRDEKHSPRKQNSMWVDSAEGTRETILVAGDEWKITRIVVFPYAMKVTTTFVALRVSGVICRP